MTREDMADEVVETAVARRRSGLAVDAERGGASIALLREWSVAIARHNAAVDALVAFDLAEAEHEHGSET